MPAPRPSALILALAGAAALSSCTTPVGPVNAQNWSMADRQAWYRASQGSRLVPYAWLLALEDTDGQPFMRLETTVKYRYLPAAPGEKSQLPVGFAIDNNRHGAKLAETDLRWYAGQKAGAKWVGMNCAACHTAELIVNEQPVRVDGGPTLADFQGFTGALLERLRATAADEGRWNRFAAKVLAEKGAGDTPANRAMLKSVFDTYLARENAIAELNQAAPGDPEYGPGRLDAVGHILNKVAYLATEGMSAARSQYHGPPGAPVSYPYLWNVPQHAHLQWNGMAPNQPIKLGGRTVLDAGALVRNTSEVIGVFADVKVTSPRAGLGKLAGYPSSIDVTNLGKMEQQLVRLKSPSWPGTLDPTLVAEGDALFRAHCAGCHNELPRDDLTSPAREHMTPIWGPGGVGSDFWMACNAYAFQARAGHLAGVSPTYIGGGSTIEPIDRTRSMLTAVAIGSLAGKKRQLAATLASGLFEREQRPTVVSPMTPDQQDSRDERETTCRNAWADTTDPNHDRALLQYKARPLNGIWATGPYLHNGSVRTLWELLLDPAKRSASFNVGSRKLDATGVGYADEAVPGGWMFRARDASGRWISGNDNRGHDYGTGSLPEAERRALVEYMKSL